MLKDAIGLILADDLEIHLGDLSRHRALGAMPFGGRYRLIDFALSNFVNTGIYNVGVSTFTKYRSLMDHIGTGSPWDLDRVKQGLHILPPNIGVEAYSGNADDIAGIYDFYRDFKQKYIIICTCKCIYNVTFDALIEAHISSGADITAMYSRSGSKYGAPYIVMETDRRRRVKGVYRNPDQPVTDKVSMGAMVMERQAFIDILSRMISQGIRDTSLTYLLSLYNELKIYGFEYKGEVLWINSLKSYFSETMRALNEPCRSAIFYSENPIFTKVKDEAPTYYNDSCMVDNSMISDGCTIQGSVQDSMLFRGVTVAGQSKIKNCILFQDTFISEGCELEHVIVDKKSVIRPGTKLIGNPNYPIVIGKDVIV